MKKMIFTLSLLLAFGGAAMAQRFADPHQIWKTISKQFHGEMRTEIYKPQFVVVEGEEATIRYSYEYDEDYLLTRLDYQTMQDGSWETYAASQYDYDFTGNVIEIFTKDVANDVEFSLETYTYLNGLLDEDVYQLWDGNNWVNDQKWVFNYLEGEYSVLQWEWSDGSWSPMYLYSYTEQGNIVELLIQYMQGGAWQNEAKQTAHYNAEGQIEEIVTELWVNNSWRKRFTTTYHYTNGMFDEMITSLWYGESSTPVRKCEYEYNAQGNAVWGESYCDSGRAWELCTGTLEMAFGSNYDVYEYEGLRFDAEYLDVTGVEDHAETAGFTFYPNPVNDVLVVRSDDFLKAEVYSLTGAKLVEATSNRVDVSALRSGMYLLKVYDGTTGSKACVFVVK